MSQTQFDGFGVIKVRGTDPEIFWIVLTNPREPKTPGLFMQTSKNLREDDLRTELGKLGFSELQMNELIERARKNPS